MTISYKNKFSLDQMAYDQMVYDQRAYDQNGNGQNIFRSNGLQPKDLRLQRI